MADEVNHGAIIASIEKDIAEKEREHEEWMAEARGAIAYHRSKLNDDTETVLTLRSTRFENVGMKEACRTISAEHENEFLTGDEFATKLLDGGFHDHGKKKPLHERIANALSNAKDFRKRKTMHKGRMRQTFKYVGDNTQVLK